MSFEIEKISIENGKFPFLVNKFWLEIKFSIWKLKNFKSKKWKIKIKNKEHLKQKDMIIEFWKTGENPITCYDSTKAVEKMPDRVPTKKNSNNQKPVTVVSKTGVKEEFESVITLDYCI